MAERPFPDFFPNFASDLRPRVTRPALAGHATCACGSLGISYVETEIPGMKTEKYGLETDSPHSHPLTDRVLSMSPG